MQKIQGQYDSALITNWNHSGGSDARHVCRFTAPL